MLYRDKKDLTLLNYRVTQLRASLNQLSFNGVKPHFVRLFPLYAQINNLTTTKVAINIYGVPSFQRNPVVSAILKYQDLYAPYSEPCQITMTRRLKKPYVTQQQCIIYTCYIPF